MINWKITNLEYYTQYQGLSNVVKTIHYIVEAKDTNGNIGQSIGTQQLDLNSITEESFLEFGGITKDKAVSWLHDSLNATDPDGVNNAEGWALSGVVNGNTNETGIGLPSNW